MLSRHLFRGRGPVRLALALGVALATLLGAGTAAHAAPDAYFHPQSVGNRGTDVIALQYLLVAHGATVDTDGVFGPGTQNAVKAFQRSAGLGDDGIVGNDTWSKLVKTVRSGDKGPAVKAVQTLLNAKRAAGLGVDGDFGGGTDRAVKAFQTHAGIGADGIVGPNTWKQLVWHYEKVNFAGTMCDQNPDGNASANWGTAAAVAQLEAAARNFGTGNGKLPVGDASFEHGGDIDGHASHERGMDIDIWPIRTDNAQCTGGRITWRSSTYDRAATRKLVNEIRAAAPGHIKFIYFNDPELISAGLTSKYDNHDNHLHIRFCERAHPNAMYKC
ncbi:penicillin-insensitive murein endopeptidase [Actinoplanes sp. NPDC051859]|uniref:peptidoglycan-binding domain-containing protein n=1 Tax=Actinoplanes sp. NPDC051859 TaxID=3363909 RepID=UPI00379F46B2